MLAVTSSPNSRVVVLHVTTRIAFFILCDSPPPAFFFIFSHRFISTLPFLEGAIHFSKENGFAGSGRWRITHAFSALTIEIMYLVRITAN